MRFALAAVVALALGTAGCVIVPARGGRAGLSAKKCPPGHVWSDGACHASGKGHDK